jgi:AraC-like DNA-binding protein
MIHSEFTIQDDHRLNFGLTVNSVGIKSISPQLTGVQEQVSDHRYHFKKGRVADEFKLIYITAGSGFMRFENKTEIRLERGNILMILPNQKYQYYHDKHKVWKELFIRFEADSLYHQLIKTLFINEYQLVEIGLNEELVRLFQRSIDVVRNGLKSSQVYLSGILLHILGMVIAETRNNVIERREKQLVEQARILMSEHVCNELSLQEIASQLNMSYTSFRKKFKQYSGVSPAKYMNELRMKKGRELLTETPFSIKEIAFMLQYSSANQFSTMFKKLTGQTPQQVRHRGLSSGQDDPC